MAATTILNPVSFVEYQNLRFLIIDAPTDANLAAYIKEFKKYNVSDVARACEGSYSIEPLTAAGIEVHEMAFADGDPPPDDVIAKWLALVKARFGKKGAKPKAAASESKSDVPATVAVHCVAGLGRAPVLVATALIEYGLEPLKAVAYIREKRRGAINARQLRYVERYKPRTGGRCVIM